ncbi:MAG TPA: TIGR01777 family oxidoreductase [Vicinamibacterales bacterium]|nr:TIGR01777 family oxidoreductase [Vicinamibacterales bacterium]
MRIVIAGGSGFLGRALSEHLVGRQHEVVILTRSGAVSARTGARAVSWQPDGSANPGTWAKEIDGAAAIVNLTGAGMADKRWTRRRKDELRQSRVQPTRSLVAAIRAASVRPATFVQGSAVGFYGPSHDEVIDESFPPGQDFLGQLAVSWEAEAHPVAALGCRLVILRSGVVLARGGGMLEKVMPPFQFFVGGPIASGRQYLSWIHLADWVALVTWVLETSSVSGPVNAASPTPVTNADFSRALGRALRRPSWLRVPGFALRLIFGEMANDMLLAGQRVVPRRALEAGFAFKHPDIDSALNSALHNPKGPTT